MNNVIVNNTIYETRTAGIRLTDGSTPNTMFNNLLIVPDGRYIMDNSGGNFIDSTSNVKRTSISGLFASSSPDNFQLSSTSAAINAGARTYNGKSAPTTDMIGTSRAKDGAWDSGAYEK